MERPTAPRPLDASVPTGVIDAFVAATVTAFEELTGSIVMGAGTVRSRSAAGSDVTASLVLRHEPPGLLLLAFHQRCWRTWQPVSRLRLRP